MTKVLKICRYDDDYTLKPDLESSMIDTTGKATMTSVSGETPTSTIVYNITQSDDAMISVSPVTSLYIYEMSSSELITRSFLAGS